MSIKTKFPVVLIHGAFGYGQTRPLYGRAFNYWPEDDLKELNPNCIMIDCGAFTSNHDRACEAFYQLYGGTVDYGEKHSKKYRHRRYGLSYDKGFLEWSSQVPVHLVGHSCGGTAALELYQLLCEDFFRVGSDASWVRSITCIASPLTGTTLPYILGIHDAEAPFKLRAKVFCGAVLSWFKLYTIFPPLRCLYDMRMEQWRDHSLFDLIGVSANTTMQRENLLHNILPSECVRRNQLLQEMDKIYLLSIATSYDSAHTPKLEVLAFLGIMLLLYNPAWLEANALQRVLVTSLLSIYIWSRAKKHNFSWLSALYWVGRLLSEVTKSVPKSFKHCTTDDWHSNDGIVNVKSMDCPWFPSPSDLQHAMESTEEAAAPLLESEAALQGVPPSGHKLRARSETHTSVDSMNQESEYFEKGRWYVYRVKGNHLASTAWDPNARKLFESFFFLVKNEYE